MATPLRRLRALVWDELSAAGVALSARVPPRAARAVRFAVDVAQRPFSPRLRVGAFEHVGHDTQLRQALAALFGQPSEDTAEVGRERRIDPDPVALRATTRAQVLAVEIDRAQAAPFVRDGWFVLPRWLRLDVDTTRSERDSFDGKKRETVSRIDRSGLSAEVVPLASAIASFHREFYVPTARARHGRLAYVRSERYLSTVGDELLFVVEGGRRVAGVMLAMRGDRLDALVTGVRGGDYQASPLAREAMYLFAIRTARERGARLLGLTSANPFLDDGLLRFKKHWGARASVPAADGRAFALRALAPVALPALVHLRDPAGDASLVATACRPTSTLAGVGPAVCVEADLEAILERARACAR